MKKMVSLLLSFALLLCLSAGMAIPASAENVSAEGLRYTVANGNATVTGYVGLADALTVPDALGGAPVTAVGVSAFENNKTLTAVTLPASVRLIDECAFAGCTALRTINIGKVATVGFSAFHGCDALSQVTFSGSETQWKAVAIARFNDPLTAASVTCLGGEGNVSLLPADRSEFLTLSEGGGVIDVFKVSEGYRFSTWTGWPSAYTRRSAEDYVTVDVFSDTYLNFDFTVHSGYTNIILAFNGMDIIDMRTMGHYVTLNRLVDPWFVDENGIIYDMGTGTYTASVHVGALGCDPALVQNGTFQISDIKIYAVDSASITVRDLSVGEAKYDVWDLPQTSYTVEDSQTLLPESASDFSKALTESWNLSVSKSSNGMYFSSSDGWPCAYTTNFETGEGYVLADPNDYIYYDFTVFGSAATHIIVYFGGTSPLSTPNGGYASLNPYIHPSYIWDGVVYDLPAGVYRGFIKVSELGCSEALLQNGKVPVSDFKIHAVRGSVLVKELAVVSIETYADEAPETTTTTAAPRITFSLSSQKATVGDTVTVDVTVTDNHYLTNGQLEIGYDPAALELIASPQTVNNAILGDCFWDFGTPTSGVARFAFANASTHGSTVGGTLFSLTFKVLDGIGDATALTLTAPEMCSAKNGIDHDTDAVYVGGEVYTAAALLLGDVTLDGVVNLADASRLFYYVNGLLTLSQKEMLVADVNEDGNVNLADASRLFYRVNGLL